MLSKDMTASEPRAMLLRGMSHIAMPELEGIDLSRTTLSFDVMGMSGNGLNGAANFQVGLLAADGEFTNLSKYVAGSDELTADGNVTHIEIDLSEIAYGELGDLAGARYSFKTNIEYIPSGYVYIDNVKAVFAPTCYEPRGLKTSLKMDTALAFEWNTPPDATKFDYILYIGATEQIQEQGTVDKAADAVKADVVFKDLKPNTPYRLRINTVCEYDDLDAVTTGYAEITETTFRRFGRIPYEYGFEDNQNVNDGVMEAENWYRPGADNGQRNIFMIDKKAISTSDDARFGEKSLYITNLRNDAYPESSAKYGYDDNIERTAYAYRTFYLEPGKYSISYDWKANGRSSDGKWNDVECGRVFFAPSTVEFAQNQPAKTDGSLNDLGSAAMIPQGSIVLDKGENLTGKTDWTLQNKVAFEVTEAGMYNLVFAWTNRSQEGVAVGNPLAIDNIVLENQGYRNSCSFVCRG